MSNAHIETLKLAYKIVKALEYSTSKRGSVFIDSSYLDAVKIDGEFDMLAVAEKLINVLQSKSNTFVNRITELESFVAANTLSLGRCHSTIDALTAERDKLIEQLNENAVALGFKKDDKPTIQISPEAVSKALDDEFKLPEGLKEVCKTSVNERGCINGIAFRKLIKVRQTYSQVPVPGCDFYIVPYPDSKSVICSSAKLNVALGKAVAAWKKFLLP